MNIYKKVKYQKYQVHEFIPDINKEIEIWKDIKGYEDRYQVSNFGNVWSLISDQQMTKTNRGEYYIVKFHDKNQKEKNHDIHRLVAKAFIKDNDPNNGPRVVDHIDDNRQNNHIDNLRWTTKSENSQSYQDNFRKKREILQCDLDGNLIKEWIGIDEILKHNPTYDKNHLQHKMNGHIAYGYLWKYKFDKPKSKQDTELQKDEIFKNIGIIKDRDFNIYEVSNYGKVRNIKDKHKFLRPAIDNKGYYKVILYDKATHKNYNMTIHNIVGNVFVEKPKDKVVDRVNHIDENKLNNYYKNLEWTDAGGNSVHSLGKKVNQLDIDTGEIINTFNSIADAERAIHSKNHGARIINCCKGKDITCYGYRWEYATE